MISDASTQRAKARTTKRRATDTRLHVLDAVVAILSDKGFSALTNALIISKTRISSGALMHHFPTRQRLLTATVEHAYAQLFAYRAEQLEHLKPGLPRFRAMIDLAWHAANMPIGFAVNEIRIGARSDARIAAAFRPVFTRIAEDYAHFMSGLVREAKLDSDEDMQGLWTATSMAMRSLAIDRKTYATGDVAAKMLLALRTLREDIIAKQMGRVAAQDPHIAWKPAK